MKLLKALYERTPTIVFVLIIVACVGFSIMRGSVDSAERCRASWGDQHCPSPVWESLVMAFR